VARTAPLARKPEDPLPRLARVKTLAPNVPDALGPALISFFKTSVQKRQTKLEKIADCWSTLVPELLNEHCALEGFNKGTLTVLVDPASHLYELKQLLLAGLEKQLLTACGAAGLRKISLKRGRWYDGADDADRRVRFI
jgi:Dna[CI] antecedent, DciA